MIASLFNQKFTLQRKGSYGADGRETVGSANCVRGRFEPKTKRLLLADGSVLTTDGIVFVAPDLTISTDDKLTYNSVTYKVVDIYPVPGGDGETHHKELRVIKWQHQ